jgi:hypothetical protein
MMGITDDYYSSVPPDLDNDREIADAEMMNHVGMERQTQTRQIIIGLR